MIDTIYSTVTPSDPVLPSQRPIHSSSEWRICRIHFLAISSGPLYFSGFPTASAHPHLDTLGYGSARRLLRLLGLLCFSC